MDGSGHFQDQDTWNLKYSISFNLFLLNSDIHLQIHEYINKYKLSGQHGLQMHKSNSYHQTGLHVIC